MTSLRSDLQLAVRRLSREPGFTLATIVTLAIGIGIAASVFALVDGILLRPLPYPDAQRLVSIRHQAAGITLTRDRVSAGMFLHYRDRNRVFEGIGTYEEMAYTLTGGDGSSERVQAATVSPELFSVLRVTPALGRLPAASDYAYDMASQSGTVGALLSHDLWARRYGADPDIIGHTIEVDGQPFAVVVGVAREGFAFPDRRTRLWLAVPPERLPWSTLAAVHQGMFLTTVARVRPGITLPEVEQDLNRMIRLLPDAFGDVTARDLETLRLRAMVRPLKDEFVGSVRATLLLVAASGAFLLLVTWANVTNLLLLRTQSRRTEIEIARALGASEGRIARRIGSETALLTCAGGALGLWIAFLATSTRFGFATDQLPRLEDVGIGVTVVVLVIALATVATLLMTFLCLASTRNGGSGPSFTALRSRSPTQGPDGHRVRSVLVGAQVAISLVLLVGSGLMVRSFSRLTKVDVGFRPDSAFRFYLPTTHLGLDASYREIAQVHDRVLQRLRALPGVASAAAISRRVSPLASDDGSDPEPIAIAGAEAPAQGWPLALHGLATPEYFRTMGIPIIAGRDFTLQDLAPGSAGAIISQALARALFGSASPIGQAVRFANYQTWAPLTVVGVVGNVPGASLRDGAARAIYLPHLPPAASYDVSSQFLYRPIWESYVIQSPRPASALLPEVRRAIHEIDPRLPVLEVSSLSDVVRNATARERITMRLLLVSAGTALVLATVGVFGLMAYAVRRRTMEIGIRIALGATPSHVARFVLAQGAVPCLGGIAAGLVLALVSMPWLSALLYETSPSDAATFVSITAFLLAVSVAACAIPAKRAVRVPPAIVLHAE